MANNLFRIFTLFPEIFPGALNYSITGEALKKGLWQLETVNIRDFANDKHKTVDDIPFGGGSGMVIKPDIIANALEQTLKQTLKNQLSNTKSKPKIIYLSPRGQKFNQNKAIELAKYLEQNQEINLLCGRYEGIDQRVIDYFDIEELSIGDYIITGGEISALVVIDAIIRNLPNVLGAKESLAEESFGNGEHSQFRNLLEYPHYTRPANWRNIEVPKILTSGHHQKIKEWRLEQAISITKNRREDLYQKFIDNLKK